MSGSNHGTIQYNFYREERIQRRDSGNIAEKVDKNEQVDEENEEKNHEIQLVFDTGVGIGGDRWPAATTFCKLLYQRELRSSFFSSLFDCKSVIELGSGIGLVSIVIEKLFNPSSIVITDLKQYLPLIQQNLDINQCNKCITMEYDWCHRPIDHQITYDIILAFECVYREELFEPLIQSMTALSNQSTVIIMGITRTFAKYPFFQLLQKHQYQYTMITNDCLHNNLHITDTALFILHKQQPHSFNQ